MRRRHWLVFALLGLVAPAVAQVQPAGLHKMDGSDSGSGVSGLTAGRVTLSTGATSVGDDAGCTWVGSGPTFHLKLGTGGVGLLEDTAGTLKVTNGSSGFGIFEAAHLIVNASSNGTSIGYYRPGVSLGPSAPVQWGDTGSSGTIDLALSRDDAGILAQKNGTNAQKFRLYKTDDGAGNAEWLQFDASGGTTYGSGYLAITNAASGTGLYKNVVLNAYPGNLLLDGYNTFITQAGTTLYGFDANSFYPYGTTNTRDLGYSATSYAWRSGYFGTSVVSPALIASSYVYLQGSNTLQPTGTSGKMGIFDVAGSHGVGLDVTSDGMLKIRNTSHSADGDLMAGNLNAVVNITLGNAVLFTNGSPVLMYNTASVGDTGGAYTFTDAIGTNLRQIKASSLLVRSTLSGSTLAEIKTDGTVVTPAVEVTLATPTTSGDTCIAGKVWADASYLYVCTATNTIKRAALSAF